LSADFHHLPKLANNRDEATITDIAKQKHAEPSIKVPSNNRGQAHFRFSVNGLTIDWDVDVIVRRCRWTLLEVFATSKNSTVPIYPSCWFFFHLHGFF
jgi:hypothetical protein